MSSDAPTTSSPPAAADTTNTSSPPPSEDPNASWLSVTVDSSTGAVAVSPASGGNGSDGDEDADDSQNASHGADGHGHMNGTSETSSHTSSGPTSPKHTSDSPTGDSKETPLETSWTFYFDKKLQQQSDYKHFQQNLRKLGSFNTVEGFWRYYAHIQRPDSMPKDHNLFLFRNSLVPAWETFPNGGCWIIKVRKHNGLINRLWEELAFACIGELFEEPNVVGIVLSTRGKDDVISVWNKDNTRCPELKFNIGEKLKRILNLDDTTRVEYKLFATSLKDGSTYRNAKPYVYAAQGSADDPDAQQAQQAGPPES